MERIVTLAAAITGAVFLFVGVHMLWADRLVRVRGLVLLSRETVGYGLGVACSAVLSYDGAPADGIPARTDGRCPAVAPNMSEVDVCHPIGRPKDAGVGCHPLLVAIACTLLGGASTAVTGVLLARRRQPGVAGRTTDRDVIALLPHAFHTPSAVYLSRPPTPSISDRDLRRLDSLTNESAERPGEHTASPSSGLRGITHAL
jgi:hypothetical protein